MIRNAYIFLVGEPEGKRPFGRPTVDGMTIFEWMLEKEGGKVWSGFLWLKIRTSDGLL
jgi:hypothetical protein